MMIFFQIISFLILPIFVGGLIRLIRARAQNRRGPGVLQVWKDIFRFLGKDSIDAALGNFFARMSPLVALVSMLIAWSIVCFEWTSFVYLVFFLTLERFSTTSFAMETGTSFGGMGVSREMLLAVSAEPTIILMILIAQTHIQMDVSLADFSMGFLFLIACFYAILAELAKPPFDDPRTHLELTMVHEAMLLEASGRKMGFFEISYQIKTATLLTLLVKLALEHTKFHKNDYLSPDWISFWVTPAVLCLAVTLGIWESICARRKWTWIPELMGLIFLIILFLGTLVKLNDL
ncbi:respiratory chain complex I subunit 1 family protein [Leptospira sp. GIMC2001]|uniref:respiratory chain complex I subunit 1 family protein n=1 Tax=Leptospira sp. GIMC2001 TaxID=1513297 RepID=UPI0023496658|nr:NADH-quinone oxidoreductase subunit H [Leptospira sp. GIMC2001]WCL48842.1 NADH-quinone oxidoreductase subunit H [Leptospira sp. GIMC2001]